MQNKQKTLLVVDDEQDILEFLKIILEEEGYTVVTTDKGDYLEKLSAHPSAKESARQAGADDFLAKPFEIDLLLNKLVHYRR